MRIHRAMGLLQRLGLPDQPAAGSDQKLTRDAGSRRPAEGRVEPSKANSEPDAAPHTAQVSALANQKGWVAKTTTTLNLSVAFAEAGHRVLAIDMDPQGNLTM